MAFSSKTRATHNRKPFSRRSFRPRCEPLEDRWTPATITVTSVGDTIGVNGLVTLREAITAANTNAKSGDAPAGSLGLDIIKFNLGGSGVHTIYLSSPLPNIQDRIDIQGYSQLGSSKNTLAVGSNAKPLIELYGAAAGASASGFVFLPGSSQSSVSGLIINWFNQAGIDIHDSDNVHVWGNFIGTDATGTQAAGNRFGVYVGNLADNPLIGGSAASERNVISGNQGEGVYENSNSASPATGLVIQNNYIGTDKTGVAALGNGEEGIYVGTAQGTIIGGASLGEGNLISANGKSGIDVSANGVIVYGNLIGTDATGTKALGNKGLGIIVRGSNNAIGGPAVKQGNLVSGNKSGGIAISAAGTGNNNLVQGNRIGTTADGSAALGNNSYGLILSGSNNAVRDNLISGNGGDGVYIYSAPTTQLKSNRIGTNAAGSAAVGNTGDGVHVLNSSGFVIGGTSAADPNVISGNGGAAVFIDSVGVQVRGNFIGTNLSGTSAIGNAIGVRITGSNNTIGGVTPATSNVISGNTTAGVYLDATANGNQIHGNRIGTDVTGLNALGNGSVGVGIVGGSGNLVGGTSAGAANTIAFNGLGGIYVGGSGGTGVHNRISGNAIFGNVGIGIDVQESGYGPTPNDPLDVDTGGNNLQNHPVLKWAYLNNGGVTIDGVLNSAPNSQFDVEYYGNTVAGGVGEGRTYLGTATVKTDAKGRAVFSSLFPLPPGGVQSVTATATSISGDTSEFSTKAPLLPSQPPPPSFAVSGAPGHVQVNLQSGAALGDFAPFAGYTGAISVAFGDVNADGAMDLIVGAITGNPHVKVYNGAELDSGKFLASPESYVLAQGFAYALNFDVGVNVASGDVNGDGYADIVTGAIPGNPHVKVFDGKKLMAGGVIPTSADSSLLAEGFVYGINFNVGANVAVADVNADGFADVITGASAGNPHTKVFDGQEITFDKQLPTGTGEALLAEFFPYGLNFNVGAFVAAGDYNGDGYADVITGASVGNPEVRVFSGKDMAQGKFDLNTSLLDSYYAFETGQNIGVSVGAADFTDDGQVDVLVGTRSGTPRLRVFQSNLPGQATVLPGFDKAENAFSGGLYVGA